MATPCACSLPFYRCLNQRDFVINARISPLSSALVCTPSFPTCRFLLYTLLTCLCLLLMPRFCTRLLPRCLRASFAVSSRVAAARAAVRWMQRHAAYVDLPVCTEENVCHATYLLCCTAAWHDVTDGIAGVGLSSRVIANFAFVWRDVLLACAWRYLCSLTPRFIDLHHASSCCCTRCWRRKRTHTPPHLLLCLHCLPPALLPLVAVGLPASVAIK